MSNPSPFKSRHFEAEIIWLCVRWYLRYALSYRDLEELMLERELRVNHTTIYRWVQRYAPELNKCCRPQLKACNDSWKVDETYIKVRKSWMYLYRAADSQGNTLEFLLSPMRDAEAAKRFFVKALHATAGSASRACPADEKEAEAPRSTEPAAGPAALGAGSVAITPNPLPLRVAPRSVPGVINVDKHAAYPKAIADLKASGVLPQSVELRQVKYLIKLVEQDHRFIKRLVKPGMGIFSMETTGPTLQGYEVMHMLRKGQVRGVGKGDLTGQVSFIARLFGVAA
jgi:transposase, IS6 family